LWPSSSSEGAQSGRDAPTTPALQDCECDCGSDLGIRRPGQKPADVAAEVRDSPLDTDSSGTDVARSRVQLAATLSGRNDLDRDGFGRVEVQRVRLQIVGSTLDGWRLLGQLEPLALMRGC
jgi:hypothetical protein